MVWSCAKILRINQNKRHHNLKCLEALMDDTPVYDIAHRHDSNNTEISYVGEQFCVVSRLADGCLV